MSKDGVITSAATIASEERPISRRTKISAVMTVVFAGIALCTDGYNAQVIGYMDTYFKALYPDTFTSTISTRLSNSYLIGEIIGMLGFGALIDVMGRKTGILLTTCFLIAGIVIATAAHGKTDLGMFWMMIVGRGLAGVGAGGEYPVCGTGATEAADETTNVRKHRGFLIGMVGDFAIDFGFVIAGVVVIIVILCYNQRLSSGIWRVCFGLGLVMPLCVFYFRLKMLNSSQFRKHAIRKQIPYSLVVRRYWKSMLGTGFAWFFYDFVSYPFGIFSSTIIAQFKPEQTVLQNIGYGTVVLTFYLPGCVVGGYLMDKIGRKNTMALGFLVQALLGFILGGALKQIQSVFALFVVLYGIFVALGEMGPGVATILCAAESYPTPLRGHLLGLSAAIGKAGAAIGTQVFTPMQNAIGGGDTLKGQQGVFLVGSAFSVVGAIITWFLVPDMERALESEDAAFKSYLISEGYDVSGMGLGDKEEYSEESE
jgi:MFS family permease